MKTTEIYRNFIKLNWDGMFAGARYGCRLYGRGALVVNILEMLERGLTPWAPVPYFPDRGTQWPTSAVARLVAEYNPEKEIALIFLCPVEGVVPYRVLINRDRINLIEYRDGILGTERH